MHDVYSMHSGHRRSRQTIYTVIFQPGGDDVHLSCAFLAFQYLKHSNQTMLSATATAHIRRSVIGTTPNPKSVWSIGTYKTSSRQLIVPANTHHIALLGVRNVVRIVSQTLTCLSG